uniref:MFS transporter n=1 Tax=Cyberlindnera americana TaxID=36016 RepID=A0A5P8N8I3_9ASCO|nr:MFS transporter [Cyberlindnera americana]
MKTTPRNPKSGVLETSALLERTTSEQAIEDDDEEDNLRVLRESRLHHSTLAWHSRPTVVVLCLALFVFFLSESTGLPSFIVLFFQSICRYAFSMEPELQTCSEGRVQSVISNVQLQLNFICGALSCVVSGKLGEISDRVGRRHMFIYVGFLNMLTRFMDIYLVSPNVSFNKLAFVVRYITFGLSGGTIVMVSLASSYITDIVESRLRTRALGFLMGSLYSAMALGPLLGSFIVSETGNPMTALYFCASLSVLFLVLMFFVLVESRPQLLRTRSQSMHLVRKASFSSQVSGRSGVITHSAKAMIDVFAPLKLLWLPRHRVLGFKPRFNVMVLVVMECFLFVAAMSIGSVIVIFSTATFNLNSQQLGYFISLVGMGKTFVMYIVCPLILHLLKLKFKSHTHAPDMIDFMMLLIGTTGELLTPILVWKSKSVYWIYAAGLCGALGALVTPTVQSTIIKYFPESKSGEVFGAISVLKNILGMIGPVMALFIYGQTVSIYPKLIFVILGAFIAFAAISSFFLKMHDELELSQFIKPRTDSVVTSDNESETIPVPASPMRAYDVIRRGSAGPSPRDPVSF